MTDKIERGHVDAYEIGQGVRSYVARQRLILTPATRVLFHDPRLRIKRRRTKDKWHRRFQAEHTGDFQHLGAVRAWTRTGAFIKMHKRIAKHRQAEG